MQSNLPDRKSHGRAEFQALGRHPKQAGVLKI